MIATGFAADRQGLNWPLIGLLTGVHVAGIAAGVVFGAIPAGPPPAETLETFIVEPDPSAAPAPEAVPQPEELVLDMPPPDLLLAPPPDVKIDLPRQAPIAASLKTVAAPVLASVAAPPVSAPAPPGPKAAPIPVTPPDFSADQLGNPGPKYPYVSRRNREQGVVILRVLVSEDGRAGALEIEESSGFERLDEAARKTVRRWNFLPARQAGKPVAAWVLVPVTFALGT